MFDSTIENNKSWSFASSEMTSFIAKNLISNWIRFSICELKTFNVFRILSNINDSKRSSAVDLILIRFYFSSIIFLIRSLSFNILTLERIISWRSKCFFNLHCIRLSTDDSFKNVFSCRDFFIQETTDNSCAFAMLRK